MQLLYVKKKSWRYSLIGESRECRNTMSPVLNRVRARLINSPSRRRKLRELMSLLLAFDTYTCTLYITIRFWRTLITPLNEFSFGGSRAANGPFEALRLFVSRRCIWRRPRHRTVRVRRTSARWSRDINIRHSNLTISRRRILKWNCKGARYDRISYIRRNFQPLRLPADKWNDVHARVHRSSRGRKKKRNEESGKEKDSLAEQKQSKSVVISVNGESSGPDARIKSAEWRAMTYPARIRSRRSFWISGFEWDLHSQWSRVLYRIIWAFRI